MTATRQNGSRNLLLLGACAVGLVVVGAGGVAAWLLTRTSAGQAVARRESDGPKNPDDKAEKPKPQDGKAPEPDRAGKPNDGANDGGKPKPPAKANGPVAAVADTEFGPATDVWDYTIRMPKGLLLRFKDKKDGGPGDASSYDWVTPGAGEDDPGQACNVLRQRIYGPWDPLTLVAGNRKLKSKPGDIYQFDTIQLPQEVEINGIPGARMWQLYTSKDKFTVSIEYRFRADDWSFYIRGVGVGKTEAEARRFAEVVDAAICTLRKR
jgi:hypothetical protein